MFIATYDQGICLSDLRYTSDRHGGINTLIPEDVFVNTDKGQDTSLCLEEEVS